jgi:hypothetical protein
MPCLQLSGAIETGARAVNAWCAACRTAGAPATVAMAKARYIALGIYHPRQKWEEQTWGSRKAWILHEARMRTALRALGYVVRRDVRSKKKA